MGNVGKISSLPSEIVKKRTFHHFMNYPNLVKTMENILRMISCALLHANVRRQDFVLIQCVKLNNMYCGYHAKLHGSTSPLLSFSSSLLCTQWRMLPCQYSLLSPSWKAQPGYGGLLSWTAEGKRQCIIITRSGARFACPHSFYPHRVVSSFTNACTCDNSCRL